MPKKRRLKVTVESPTGLNKQFEDTTTGENLTRREAANRIEQGEYPGYHIMHKDGKRIPRSNPNNSTDDNLG